MRNCPKSAAGSKSSLLGATSWASFLAHFAGCVSTLSGKGMICLKETLAAQTIQKAAEPSETT
jgi:hypothetical protein